MKQKPLITLYIFSYNQQKYIQQAVESALAQEYSPLEIIISDDCSTDSTVTIIESVVERYTGPHSVHINVNPINLGISEHVNQAFKIAKGEFIVFAAGDDISFPRRVCVIADRWCALDKKVSAIYSGAKLIDENGKEHGLLKVALSDIELNTHSLITYKPKSGTFLLIGACAAYAANLNHKFGDLLPNVNVEDIPLTIRASLTGGIIYIDETLLFYRQNVSVWLPRKLKNESFCRHRQRVLHYIRTNYDISRQINLDVSVVNSNYLIRKASMQRLIAAEFIQKCIEKEHFSPLIFVNNLSKTPHWSYMLFPTIFFANRHLHHLVYKLYTLFKGH